MRTCATLAMCVCLCSVVSAQGVVKVDLMKMLANVPPPPSTAREAFSRVSTTRDGNEARWNADTTYGAFEKEAKETEAAIEQRKKSAVLPGTPADMSKNMQDAEMKKKMKNMTTDEKMKMAMEMMKSMPKGQPVSQTDPPPVVTTLEEWSKVHRNIATEFQWSSDIEKQRTQLLEENEKKHADIDVWAQTEISKLPHFSSGETSAPDPAEVKKVRLRAYDRHIAVADEQLRQAGESWRKVAEHKKALYTPFHDTLKAADYASGSTNPGTTATLSDAQGLILGDVTYLMEWSRKACEEAARWVGKRKEIEEKKVE